jgi:hypothetical protein
MDWARRRLGVLAGHLAPDGAAAAARAGQGARAGEPGHCCYPPAPDCTSTNSLSRCPTSSSGTSVCDRCCGNNNNTTNNQTPYASADPSGAPTSYARVHGAVSRAPPRWRRIASVARETLSEVIYEKAEGEGIAKVGQA